MSTRYYQPDPGEGHRDREMFELIGRIVVAWGAAESVLAKMWWHKAFEGGVELQRDRVYRAPTSEKLIALRKLIPADHSRADQQLARVEMAYPDLEPDRHALVHGYLAMTARGPASLNLRNDHAALAIDLPGLLEWSVYLADVAHQIYEEATVHIYHGVERLFLPDPVQPLPYNRSAIPGRPSS